jgi:hypothetical protein
MSSFALFVTVCKIYIVNSPYILNTIWKWVSPFIEPDTLLKVKILSNNYFTQFQKDEISLDSIPVELGGKNKGSYILDF